MSCPESLLAKHLLSRQRAVDNNEDARQRMHRDSGEQKVEPLRKEYPPGVYPKVWGGEKDGLRSSRDADRANMGVYVIRLSITKNYKKNYNSEIVVYVGDGTQFHESDTDNYNIDQTVQERREREREQLGNS